MPFKLQNIFTVVSEMGARINVGARRAVPLLLLLISTHAYAYPDVEITATGGPPFSIGFVSTISDALIKDDRTMIVSYGENLKLVDLAAYSFYPSQPVPLSEEDGTEGNIMGIAYDGVGNRVFASQDDGDLLIFDLDDLTQDPVSVAIADGNQLGHMALSWDSSKLYIINNNTHSVVRMTTADNKIVSTIPLNLTEQQSLIITDAVYVQQVSGAYFSTDSGTIFFVSDSSDAAVTIVVDPTYTIDISSLASGILGTKIFATDKTNAFLIDISTGSNSITTSTIDISTNNSPTSVIVADVYNPTGGGTGTASYFYAAGTNGISIGSASTDEVFNMGTNTSITNGPLPTSITPTTLLSSSSTDGYIYALNADLSLGIISENPWISIVSGPVYPSGKTSIGIGDSFTITFKSDTAGTYELRSGGDVTATGTLLKDSSGNTGGNIAANTELTLTFNYSDNASAFIEGINDIFIFVTDSTPQVAQRGRRVFKLSVDTPPPVVTLLGTGFGNQKAYITFSRLTPADMDHYNVYADLDLDNVIVKTDVSVAVSQPSSGSAVEGVVTSLTNGAVYYLAVEGVDAAGNKSASRAYLLDGVPASSQPQKTVGPAGGIGEAGCGLMGGRKSLNIISSLISIFLFLLPLLIFVRNPLLPPLLKGVRGILLFFLLLFMPSILIANDFSYHASLKGGIWMPSAQYSNSYFGRLKNVVTRLQGGIFYKENYGAEASAGFMWRSGNARGEINNAVSADKYNFYAWPFELNALWRIKYWDWDYLVPYFKAGPGCILYYESSSGSSLTNYKFGMQGGLGFLIRIIDDNNEMGIQKMYLSIDGQYNWYNNFGRSNTLDMSGGLVSLGFTADF